MPNSIADRGQTAAMTVVWSRYSRSRRALVFTVVIVLLVLDVARSVYARVGYAQPTELWQPNPTFYGDLAWLPTANVPPGASAGQRVYLERCAVCHGPDGRGNGPAAPSMVPRPRDFTQAEFKYKSTPAGQPATDDDLLRTVTQGLTASGMPYFGDLLSDSERRAVVDYVKTLSPGFSGLPPTTLVVPARVTPDSASIDRGKMLYTQQGCVACHGTDGHGGIELKDAKGYPVLARDLTAPWTFRGGSAPEDVWLRLTTGLPPGPMPAFDRLSPEDRWDLVNYVLSLQRVPPWEPGGTFGGPGQQTDPVRVVVT
jgi:mono/diheme cytochrome c family protein